MSTADDPIRLKDVTYGEPAAEPFGEPFVLTAEEREAIAHEAGHYDEARAAVIEALKIVQKRHGWVPDGAIPAIADILGVSAPDVEGVATFYNLVFRQPVGRHVIKLCDSISCFLTGHDAVLAAFVERLGISPGQTTPDNRYTLLPICCLGACDHGPVAMIDDDTHFDLDPGQIGALLERYP